MSLDQREQNRALYLKGGQGSTVLLRLECPELRLGLDSGGEGGDFVGQTPPISWRLVKDGSAGVGGLD